MGLDWDWDWVMMVLVLGDWLVFLMIPWVLCSGAMAFWETENGGLDGSFMNAAIGGPASDVEPFFFDINEAYSMYMYISSLFFVLFISTALIFGDWLF